MAFGDTEIEIHKFHYHRNPIPIYDVDINKIIVSNRVSFGKEGFKYFIGYKDNKKARPLYIMLPKVSAYKRNFDETKHLSFSEKDDELLEKYNKV